MPKPSQARSSFTDPATSTFVNVFVTLVAPCVSTLVSVFSAARYVNATAVVCPGSARGVCFWALPRGPPFRATLTVSRWSSFFG